MRNSEGVCVECDATSGEHHLEDCPYFLIVDDLSCKPEAPRTLPPMKAAELLGRAAQHMHDRAATYDRPEGERSMGRTVDAFNAITGHALTEAEGWLLLETLKNVRAFTRNEPHRDSYEDAIAYSALKAEAALRGGGE